jgi:hypothetical protein
MAKEELSAIGIWKLISLESQADDGTLTYPFGKDVAGLAMIDARGYFSAQVMNMKRPPFKISDPRSSTPEEVKTARIYPLDKPNTGGNCLKPERHH